MASRGEIPEVTSVGSATWGTITSKDNASFPGATRPPVAESNGRTLPRRPTRVLPGPPPWILRRQES